MKYQDVVVRSVQTGQGLLVGGILYPQIGITSQTMVYPSRKGL